MPKPSAKQDSVCTPRRAASLPHATRTCTYRQPRESPAPEATLPLSLSRTQAIPHSPLSPHTQEGRTLPRTPQHPSPRIRICTSPGALSPRPWTLCRTCGPDSAAQGSRHRAAYGRCLESHIAFPCTPGARFRASALQGRRTAGTRDTAAAPRGACPEGRLAWSQLLARRAPANLRLDAAPDAFAAVARPPEARPGLAGSANERAGAASHARAPSARRRVGASRRAKSRDITGRAQQPALAPPALRHQDPGGRTGNVERRRLHRGPALVEGRAPALAPATRPLAAQPRGHRCAPPHVRRWGLRGHCARASRP